MSSWTIEYAPRASSRQTAMRSNRTGPSGADDPPPSVAHAPSSAAAGAAKSSPFIDTGSELRQRERLLRLVLPLLVGIRGLAHLVALEEEHLGDPLVGVDLGGERRRVRDLERHNPLPLGLEGSDVHDDPAAGVGRLPDADGEDAAR